MPRRAQQLASLRKQRDEVASEVERLVHALPLWPVPTSMPGVGVRTAARLLTEVAHKAFASTAHLTAYAGLARALRPLANTHPGGATRCPSERSSSPPLLPCETRSPRTI
ncbi:transposase, partial [Paraburkholderia aspalathi]|uniref:transposase n=1 Tax=Paraburkholderia aspalathi TaxID=1324617 RepID=UPI0038BC4941